MSRRLPRLIETTGPVGADRATVASFATALKESHLHCREMGHNWRHWVARFDQEHHSYQRALRCTRCRTERWEFIGRSGAKLGIQYKYPEGYTAEGIGRIVGEGRDALRLESLMRALSEDDKQAEKRDAKREARRK